jgi:hypothetical protein
MNPFRLHKNSGSKQKKIEKKEGRQNTLKITRTTPPTKHVMTATSHNLWPMNQQP